MDWKKNLTQSRKDAVPVPLPRPPEAPVGTRTALTAIPGKYLLCSHRHRPQNPETPCSPVLLLRAECLPLPRRSPGNPHPFVPRSPPLRPRRATGHQPNVPALGPALLPSRLTPLSFSWQPASLRAAEPTPPVPPRDSSPNEPIFVSQPQENKHYIDSQNEPNVPALGPRASAQPPHSPVVLLATRIPPRRGASPARVAPRATTNPVSPRPRCPRPSPAAARCAPYAGALPQLPTTPRSPTPTVPTRAACHNGANGGDGRGHSPISVQSGPVQ
jgi:hypothetical protein